MGIGDWTDFGLGIIFFGDFFISDIVFELFLCEEEVPFTGTSVFGIIILEHKFEQFPFYFILIYLLIIS